MPVVKIIRIAVLGMCLGLSAHAFQATPVGGIIRNPATLAARDLDELIGLVADSINPSQIGKHAGDFEAYYGLAEDGRAGKVFEAVVAERSNLKLSNGKALLVAAAEGDKAGPADMMLATKTEAGYVVDELYQLKFRTLDLDGQRKMYGIRPDAPIARVSERWRGPANRICL